MTKPERTIARTVLERFEEQARLKPDDLAVQSGERRVTYDELNRTANRITNALLRKRGAQAGAVSILMEKNVESIAAILGVLKSGRMYIPLEPSDPPARIAELLRDFPRGPILTDTAHSDLAERVAGSDGEWISVETLSSDLSDGNPSISVSPESSACVFFTSGSTGRPKGMIHSHRNLFEIIARLDRACGILASDRLSQIPRPGVIGSAIDSFCALLNGASLHLYDARKQSATEMAQAVIRDRITFYHSVVTIFRNLTATLRDGEIFSDMRILRLSGESLLKRDIEMARRHLPPDCVILVGYGMTETANIAFFRVDERTRLPEGRVPAGYPLEGVEIIVEDEGGKALPSKGIGEIVIKTRELAEVGNTGSTSTRIRSANADPNAFKIHRTGDLGFLREDGCLEVRGRKDFLIKFRGMRIDPSEVEFVLLDHPAIREAVLVLRSFGPEDDRLVAYLTLRSAVAPTVSELRKNVSERLPPHMIPSVFVILERFPLTHNSKIDRGALPSPGATRPALDNPYVAPRNAMEEILAGIWIEVLKLDRIGVEDHFLELGGNSLLAAQIISRINARLTGDFSIRSFFESPTIARLALVNQDELSQKGPDGALDRLLTEIESLSDDQVRALLNPTDPQARSV